jgi:hypothetical protein
VKQETSTMVWYERDRERDRERDVISLRITLYYVPPYCQATFDD